MPEKAIIGVDYSHNNVLTFESSSYSEFTQFLFTSGYKLGKIQAGFHSLSKIEKYHAIIISTPRNKKLSEEEIEVLEEYVRKGGSLLIVSSRGGDYVNKTNLNDLTSKFGFEFNNNEINDSMNFVNLQKRPLLTKLTPHPVSKEVRKIVYSSACSLKILDFIEDEVNIKIEEIVKAGLNCWSKEYDGEKDDWIQKDSPRIPLMAAVEYFEGRVVGFGNLSMFSSLGREYGFNAFDNDVIIANILKWLTIGAISEGQVVTITMNDDLFYWTDKLISEENWENISSIVNVSLKYFKDNYKEIIDEIKKIQEEKEKKKKKFLDAKEKAKKGEDKILEMVPTRKKEDLEDIMSALEDITGEKYELSIDLDDVEGEGEEIDKEDEEKEKKKKVEAKEEFEAEEEEKKPPMKEDSEKETKKLIDDEVKKKIEDEIIKEQEDLEKELEEELEKEDERVMEIAKKELEEDTQSEIGKNKTEEIEKEYSKKFAGEIKEERKKVIQKAKSEISEETKKLIEKWKKGLEDIESSEADEEKVSKREKLMEKAKKDLEEKRKKIIQKAKKEMEKDRKKRVNKIKEREKEIIEDNQEFLNGILEATDIFDAPDLGKKKKEKSDEE